MPLRVRRLPQAVEDAFDIWATIAVDNERAADRLVARFYAAEDLLAAFPEIGEARPEIATDLRKWTVSPYVMLYRVTDIAVEVVRIVHGARDLPKLFEP